MNIEIGITSNDIISYMVLFIVTFVGGLIGARMGCMSACILEQRKIRTRDDIERRMDKELDKELPYLKSKVEHRDHRLDD